jgi:hypothetical protein
VLIIDSTNLISIYDTIHKLADRGRKLAFDKRDERLPFAGLKTRAEREKQKRSKEKSKNSTYRQQMLRF